MWMPVTSGYHRDLLGPLRFNIFVSDLEVVTGCTLAKFADDFKLGRTVNTLVGRAAIQRDPGRLEEGANRNLMENNKNCT